MSDSDSDDELLPVYPAVPVGFNIPLLEAKKIISICLRTIIYRKDLWFLATHDLLDKGFRALHPSVQSINQMKAILGLHNITNESLKIYFGFSGLHDVVENSNLYPFHGTFIQLTDDQTLHKINLINELIRRRHSYQWIHHIWKLGDEIPIWIDNPADYEGKKHRKSNRKSNRKAKKSVKKRGCTLQTTKKYSTRPSPPYPANECKHYHMFGNDGNRYRSVGNKNGVYTWKRVQKKK